MTGITLDRPTGGSLAASISHAVVQIMAEYTGRGPTRARTSIRQDSVLVLMQDTLTKAELALLEAGEREFVLQSRIRFQRTMRADLVAAVEALTGRRVIAFPPANHMEPNTAAEMFVLEPRTHGEYADRVTREMNQHEGLEAWEYTAGIDAVQRRPIIGSRKR
ncbi:MAG TPA: Na-translocating system protein MpsC family protein [Solirubrobacteraceae bacterium]|nr:Na-translocating system protein MpsC family protein [Solirubrobacteraceae bacterium]